MEIVCKYFLLFLFYSFLGWILEMVVCSIADKKVVNRGFLIGPYCPIYGSGCLLIISLLHKYQDDPFTLFIMAIIVCSLLEYFTSYIMEKLFKARWWDYSDRRFNINGRICLDNLVLFGVLGLLIFYVANPFFGGLIDRFNDNVLMVVTIVLFVVFIVDGIISLKVISGFKNVAKSIHKDSTDEITSKVRELLLEKNWLYKRLIKAFDFKASERLLKEIHKRAKQTIEKGVEVTQKTIQAGAEVAHKTIKTGVEVTQKTIKETKKIVKEKVSDFNDKKRK
jgi:uncharacterized membrane protein